MFPFDFLLLIQEASSVASSGNAFQWIHLFFSNRTYRFYYRIYFSNNFEMFRCKKPSFCLAEDKRLWPLMNIISFGTTFYNYTYGAGEYQLTSVVFKNPQCLNNSNGILTVRLGGRLGNKIWEYMSLIAFKKKYFINGRIFLQPGMKQYLQNVFDRIDDSEMSDLPESCIREAHVKKFDLTEDPKFFNFSQNNLLITLPQYSCRYIDVASYGLENIRQKLRFRQEWIDKGTRELKTVKAILGFNETDIVTFIGVHYRGGDYTRALINNYSKKFVGPPSYLYYRNAMKYFNHTTKNPIFVFISIDNIWTAKNFKYLQNFNIVKIHPVGATEDLVTLSLCNHSIINYGTYSATAALFANGVTFVYDLKLPYDGRGYTLANNMAKVYPNWFLCDNKNPCGNSTRNTGLKNI